MFTILILVVFAYSIYRGKELGYFDKFLIKPTPEAPQVSNKFYPCLFEGSIDMPPMEDVAQAAIVDVKAAGLYKEGMTKEECMNLCSVPVQGQAGWDGVNTFGGGGPYGGRYLTGSFHIEIDANGQQIPTASWIKLFSDEKFPVTGGVFPDGKINMGSIGGTQIQGSLVTGKPVGKILHGDGKHHIYGNLNGGFKLV
jgi:hypothetical protein